MVSSIVMAASPPPRSHQLQSMLQAAVQSVQWTYSLFWQLCPQRGMLVWGDGYYNGAIKTRKTVQPVEVSTEEASLQRSEQLRELYEALSAGESNQPAKRPSAALSPEDLTESEWFYLMCVSFSFPPGVGLPGKAYVKQQHVWLTGANEVESKVFSRAILAKSAHVQTVVCIPILHGVIELGTTDKVYEDLEFVNRVKSFFIGAHDLQLLPHAKPALSGHSTSNNTTISHTVVYAAPEPPGNGYDHDDEENDEEDEPNDNEEEDDDEDDDDDDEERELLGALLESEAEVEMPHTQTAVMMAQEANMVAIDNDYHQPSHHELMQLDLSEDIRFGSPDDGSDNLGSDFHLLGVNQSIDQINLKWPDLHNYPSHNLHLHHAQGTPRLEELSDEDTHYSHTVSIILRHQSTKCPDPTLTSGHSIYPNQSAFSTWTTDHRYQNHRLAHGDASSQQRLLKYIVFTVPSLHHSAAKSTDGRKGTTSQDELSANHVLAERRRREKLNERFIILRSLVPVVTKMDKASILGDTIEYVKQLRKKIQDLEARARHTETDNQAVQKRKKPKALEAAPPRAAAGDVVQVEVSIIESDALVEIQCPYREGLLLDVMKKLRELRVEIRTVQSSLNNGICAAEMRAKVKESANGKKLSIMEVKKAINQIIPSPR